MATRPRTTTGLHCHHHLTFVVIDVTAIVVITTTSKCRAGST
jgi:hypothetical protein